MHFIELMKCGIGVRRSLPTEVPKIVSYFSGAQTTCSIRTQRRYLRRTVAAVGVQTPCWAFSKRPHRSRGHRPDRCQTMRPQFEWPAQNKLDAVFTSVRNVFVCVFVYVLCTNKQ